jgi:uncharacterized protein YggU (UPF0235/DUF167 family)
MKIAVTVRARGRATAVARIDEGNYKVMVKASSEGGKAQSQVRIVIGKTSREKLIEIS